MSSHHGFRHFISVLFESLDKIVEDDMFLQFWNIFHGNDFGKSLQSEPEEESKKVPLMIFRLC